jgi:hypothetical protein
LLVLVFRRESQRLTEILLVKTRDGAVGADRPVIPLDDEARFVANGAPVDGGNLQPHGFGERHAEELVGHQSTVKNTER